MRIPHPKENWGPPLPPALCYIWADKGGYFQKLSLGSLTSDMTSKGLGEIFEGDYADMCNERISLMAKGGKKPHRREWNSMQFSIISVH